MVQWAWAQHDKKDQKSLVKDTWSNCAPDCPLQLSRPFHCFGSAATTPTEAFGRHGAACDCSILHFSIHILQESLTLLTQRCYQQKYPMDLLSAFHDLVTKERLILRESQRFWLLSMADSSIYLLLKSCWSVTFCTLTFKCMLCNFHYIVPCLSARKLAPVEAVSQFAGCSEFEWMLLQCSSNQLPSLSVTLHSVSSSSYILLHSTLAYNKSFARLTCFLCVTLNKH